MRAFRFLAAVVLVAIAAGVGVIAMTSSRSDGAIRNEISADLAAVDSSAATIADYQRAVQGGDAALASAFADAIGQGPNNGFLLSGSLQVTSLQLVNDSVASFTASDSFRAGAGATSFMSQIVGAAIDAGGFWKLTWPTACFLVESEGVVCPDPPSRSSTVASLPYSLSGRHSDSEQVHDLIAPQALAVRSNGDLLIADYDRDQILERAPNGSLTVFAGTGLLGYSGDGGPATAADFDHIGAIALSPDGTLYVADTGNCRLRAISPGGIVRTVARLCHLSGVAVSRHGEVVVSDDTFVDSVGRNGTVTRLAGAVGDLSADDATITPKTVVFTPTGLAFDGKGNLDIFSFEPKDVYRLTPDHRIEDLGAVRSESAWIAASPSGSVFVSLTNGPILRVGANGLVPDLDIASAKISGFSAEFPNSGYQFANLTVAANGTMYADIVAGEQYLDATSLFEIARDGRARVLPVTTPLVDTLAPIGAPSFPAAFYPQPVAAQTSALSSCPSPSGVEPFDGAATTLARRLARSFDSYPSGFPGDLAASDRSWWPGLVSEWSGDFYDAGTHDLVRIEPATKDTFAGFVAAACGTRIVDDSLVAVLGPSSYSDQVTHLFLIDRRGRPLVYFQAE